MTLEETTQLYASVLRQLLPTGGYDTSPNTEALAVDVYAHAKLLAQADLDGKRLLKVLEELPPELLPEYETEYGLPLKCSINAGRTLEERLEILKWVRSTNNVLNRTYLEQILAIFGVVFLDVMKFKPMQCTASCNAPVNTEQLRYKVLLKLQYPVDADVGCIIENYLPAYLRFDLLIDMPWGDWTLNAVVTVNSDGIAHYTAYRTNQREYYDSFADLDLTEAVTRSFYDTDMQQSQAVNDAVSIVEPTAIDYSINSSELVFNIKKQPENVATDEIVNVILDRYVTSPQNFVGKEPFHTLMIKNGYELSETEIIQKRPDPESNAVLKYTSPHSYASGSSGFHYSINNCVKGEWAYLTAKIEQFQGGTYISNRQTIEWYDQGRYGVFEITFSKYGQIRTTTTLVTRYGNPDYNPNYMFDYVDVSSVELRTALQTAIDSHATDIADVVSDLIDSAFNYDDIAGSNSLYESTLSVKSFLEISQQLALNTQSNNQAVSLPAKTYLENIAQSIFSTDESKRFVKIIDLSSQLELNQTFRK